MLFSFNKLKNMAALKDVKVEEVVKAINSIGFEVEEYYPFVNVKKIRFGKVLDITKNPNGEKLNVCKIQFADKVRTIQTVATNIQVGMTIIAFVPGSSVNGTTFEAKELKGIVSEGMLSSPSEFGINKELIRNEHIDGIAAYDEVKDLSLDPIEYLDLDDFIIDVTILSNRSDANSYYVMALELAAYFKTKVTLPSVLSSQHKASIKVSSEGAKSLVMIEATKDFKISIQEQIFLAKHGVKSINDIVDLTNLTLLMSGQPTHAYDKKLVGSNFTVGKYTGKVNVFGNKEVELKDDLVILANDKPVSVAGVIGLESTGVNQDTNDFIIELGRFNIKEVRKATKAVKLNTDASNQSSKEIALGTTELALRYLSTKLRNSSEAINFKAPLVNKINYDENLTSELAGFDLSNDKRYKDVIESLTILGFKFEEDKVVIPNYRHDIETQQDLNEEVFRFYGYDNFKPEMPKIIPFKVEKPEVWHDKVAAIGYQEVNTYSLISKETNVINPFDFKKNVNLETFISKEREVIRNSQALSLLQVIEYNVKRKMTNLSIFDIGMIGDGFKTLALSSTSKSFAEMKQDVVNLLGDEVVFERMNHENFHSGVSAKIIFNKKQIGWIGKVHPRISSIDAFVAEVLLPLPVSKVAFNQYDNQPLKTRDITFELKAHEELGAHLEAIKQMPIFRIDVIDHFKTGDISKVTIRIVADDKTIAELDAKYN